MPSAASAWWRLFRPQNAAIAGAGVWLGYSGLSAPPGSSLPLWGCLSMALLAAAGNADNDICDLEADRINHPKRPLPSGLLPAAAAGTAAYLLYGLAVLAAGMGSLRHGALAAGMAILLWAYNRRLQGLPLLGNLAVSLLCAAAIYFTEFPGPPLATAPACIFAFLATWAREGVKDLEDMAGDRAAGLKTLPLAAGPDAARKLVFALTGSLLALLPVPLAYPGYAWPYGVVATLLAAPFLLALMLELSKPAPDYARCSYRFKLLMVAGMAALWVGMAGNRF